MKAVTSIDPVSCGCNFLFFVQRYHLAGIGRAFEAVKSEKTHTGVSILRPYKLCQVPCTFAISFCHINANIRSFTSQNHDMIKGDAVVKGFRNVLTS